MENFTSAGMANDCRIRCFTSGIIRKMFEVLYRPI